MPKKIDPEPWFEMWESCMVLGSLNQPEMVNRPAFRHKTCGLLAQLTHTRIPPQVCPNCRVDTKAEYKQQQELIKRFGGVAVVLDPKGIPGIEKKPELTDE